MYAFPKRKLNVQLWDFRDHFPQIAAFWENPDKNWSNLAKIQQKFSKSWQNLQHFCKNQQKIQQFLTKKLRLENGALLIGLSFSPFRGCFGQVVVSPVFDYGFQKRCKGVHCVDLGESFPTSIYLQNLALIQPRTSLFNFFNFNPPLVI